MKMETRNNEITAEDIKLGTRMWEARQKGLYFETKAVTNLYNKLYNTNLNPTNCGSCIRKRIDGIHNKLEELKRLTEPKEEIIEQKIEENGIKEEINNSIGEVDDNDTFKTKNKKLKKVKRN